MKKSKFESLSLQPPPLTLPRSPPALVSPPLQPLVIVSIEFLTLITFDQLPYPQLEIFGMIIQYMEMMMTG